MLLTSVYHSKCTIRRVVNVLLLNGRSINISCNTATTTAVQILEAVVRAENLADNFFLGLCALIGGDFVFLPADMKIHKVRLIFIGCNEINWLEHGIWIIIARGFFLFHRALMLFAAHGHRLHHRSGEVFRKRQASAKMLRSLFFCG